MQTLKKQKLKINTKNKRVFCTAPKLRTSCLWCGNHSAHFQVRRLVKAWIQSESRTRLRNETRHKDEPLEQLHDNISFSAERHATEAFQLTATAPSEILKLLNHPDSFRSRFSVFTRILASWLSLTWMSVSIATTKQQQQLKFSAQVISSLRIRHFNCNARTHFCQNKCIQLVFVA